MNQSQSQTIVLLMAAGFSRRFKAEQKNHKLLYLIDDKLPLLNITFQLYEQLWSKNSITLITNNNVPDIINLAQTLTKKTVIVESDSLGSSIAGAIEKLQEANIFDSSMKGILIALADMPFIALSTLKILKNEIDQHPNRIIRPMYHNQPGHPVYFPMDLVNDLQKLHQKDGAKSIIQKNLHRLMDITVGDKGILKDIDRLSDLQSRK